MRRASGCSKAGPLDRLLLMIDAPPRALDLERIRDRLARHRAQRFDAAGGPFAAVALILTGGPLDPSILFIERAKRIGDPWSGHMAFPGGRIEESAGSPRARPSARPSRRSGSTSPEPSCSGGSTIRRVGARERRGWAGRSPATSTTSNRRGDEPSPEVEEALWVPSSALLEPRNRVDYTVSYAPGAFPGILVGKPDRHIIWGLTYRFLESFLGILGRACDSRRYGRRRRPGAGRAT